MGGLGEEKRKKSPDLVIDRSVELFGYTPDEKSDRNLEWMLENGYSIRHRRGSWASTTGGFYGAHMAIIARMEPMDPALDGTRAMI